MYSVCFENNSRFTSGQLFANQLDESFVPIKQILHMSNNIETEETLNNVSSGMYVPIYVESSNKNQSQQEISNTQSGNVNMNSLYNVLYYFILSAFENNRNFIL